MLTDDFNPRIPQGMRRKALPLLARGTYFNPRIPQGMRQKPDAFAPAQEYFNPRIPQGMRRQSNIAYLEESNFNPRIPQGMRQFTALENALIKAFQSTHSAGNATIHGTGKCTYQSISIHAFRRECDGHKSCYAENGQISIHAFRRECDDKMMSVKRSAGYFNPRIPQGMRL